MAAGIFFLGRVPFGEATEVGTSPHEQPRVLMWKHPRRPAELFNTVLLILAVTFETGCAPLRFIALPATCEKKTLLW